MDTAKERQGRTDDQGPEHRHGHGHDHLATPSNSTTHASIVAITLLGSVLAPASLLTCATAAWISPWFP
jgi:hypothetical protein